MQDAGIQPDTAIDSAARPDQGWLGRAVAALGEGWALVDRAGRIEDVAGAFHAIVDCPPPQRFAGARLRDIVRALRSDTALAWPPAGHDAGWRWTARRKDGQSVVLATCAIEPGAWVLRAHLLTGRQTASDATAHLPPGLYHPVTRLPHQPLLLDRLQQAIERSRRTVTHRFALILVDIAQSAARSPIDDVDLRLIARHLEQAVRPADTVAHLERNLFAVMIEPVRGDDASARIAIDACIDNLSGAARDAGASDVTAQFSPAVGDGGSHPADLIAKARTGLTRHGEDARRARPNRTGRMPSDGPDGDQSPVAVSIEYRPEDRRPLAIAINLTGPLDRRGLDAALHGDSVLGVFADDGPADLVVTADHLPSVETILDLRALVADWRRDAGLVIELADAAVAHDPETAIQLIDVALRHGVRFGIAGFGGGLCSDTLIGRLPLVRLTLDSDLVAEARHHPEPRIRLAAAVAWAHDRGRSVVAGDMVDDAAITMLANLGCDVYRGRADRPATADHA